MNKKRFYLLILITSLNGMVAGCGKNTESATDCQKYSKSTSEAERNELIMRCIRAGEFKPSKPIEW